MKVSTQKLSWSPNAASPCVIRGIDFLSLENKVTGIIGPNGSGKTTLLRCLYQSLTPSSGDIFIGENNLSSLGKKDIASLIGVVPQEYPADFNLSVEDILYLGFLPLQPVSHQQSKSKKVRLASIGETLKLNELLHRDFTSLSGGEKQRVMIGRALLQEPAILILDEPTNHLDIYHQIEILNILNTLSITVICSLHDLNLAANYCHYLNVMKEGSLVIKGEPENILSPQLLEDVFSINANIQRDNKTNKTSVIIQ